MTIPTTMADLSVTANSNSPADSDNANTIGSNQRVTNAILRGLSTKGSDITSASTITIPAFGSYFVVTGTTSVNAVSSTNTWLGKRAILQPSGTQTWASTFFADGQARTLLSGDKLELIDTDGSATYKCVGIHRANASIPVSTTTTTAAIGDRGQINFLTAGITIPANVFSSGDFLLYYNNSASNVTLTQGSSLTLRLAGTTSTGNRTFGARGECAIKFISATEAVVSGSGLS